MPRVRLALIDDHKIIRDGLKALLSTLDSCEVVAEGNDGHDAVALADDPDIDVFVMDIAMPGLTGLDATEQIVAKRPDARIIVLSMHADEYVTQAMSRGVRGYMIKNLAPDELEAAILKVAAGGTYLSPSLRARNSESRPSSEAEAVRLLTKRQREILTAMANGRSTRDIAEFLAISIKTVETHRSQLMQKLDIHDVPGLVKFAVRHGLVSLE